MIEKLIELAEKLWTLVTPMMIVHPWQGAAVTRCGKFHREVGPGYHLKWPLLEDAHETETCVTTLRLPPQSLTTKDRVEVVVSSILKYKITDLRKYTCDVYDQKDALADLTMGAIGRSVRARTYEELMATPPEDVAIEEARKDANAFGFKLLKLTFTDLCRAKSIRLVQALAKDIDN